jgi:hypothetical protein
MPGDVDHAGALVEVDGDQVGQQSALALAPGGVSWANEKPGRLPGAGDDRQIALAQRDVTAPGRRRRLR